MIAFIDADEFYRMMKDYDFPDDLIKTLCAEIRRKNDIMLKGSIFAGLPPREG